MQYVISPSATSCCALLYKHFHPCADVPSLEQQTTLEATCSLQVYVVFGLAMCKSGWMGIWVDGWTDGWMGGWIGQWTAG